MVVPIQGIMSVNATSWMSRTGSWPTDARHDPRALASAQCAEVIPLSLRNRCKLVVPHLLKPI